MTFKITAAGVAAICSVVTLMTAALGFYVYAIVNKVVTRAIRDLNGYYVRSNRSQLTGHEIEGRITRLEDDHKVIHEKIDRMAKIVGVRLDRAVESIMARMDKSLEMLSRQYDSLDKFVTNLHEYTHSRIHDLANRIQIATMGRDV